MTMKKPLKPGEVSVAAFKAKLSGFLRKVRAGQTLVVTDHGKPVARVIPIENENLPRTLPLRPFSAIAAEFAAENRTKPISDGTPTSLELLLEDRRKR